MAIKRKQYIDTEIYIQSLYTESSVYQYKYINGKVQSSDKMTHMNSRNIIHGALTHIAS